jgi:hypothetical protein
LEIFISWSGPKSEACALALRDWLPCVMQAIKPFVSSEDVEKGARGGLVIAKTLEKMNFGLVCLTPGNLASEWIHFESGALAKNIEDSALYTLLIDLNASDIKQPLGSFQHTRTTRNEVWKLVRAINKKLEKPLEQKVLESTFEVFWPTLEANFSSLPDEGVARPKRSTEDLLEEILSTVREQRSAGATGSNIDAVKQRGLRVAAFTEGYWKGKGEKELLSMAMNDGNAELTLRMHGAEQVVVIPLAVAWAETKKMIMTEVDNFVDIPF